jgi:single-strand DNA-binding protein
MFANSVYLIGFLGSDAETRTTKDGIPFTVLSLATKRSWKNAQGEWESHTDWHRMTRFGATAEFGAGLRKGAHLHVTGYLHSREAAKPVTGNSKKSGATVKLWEVRAVRIAKLDRAVQEDPSPDIPADDPCF